MSKKIFELIAPYQTVIWDWNGTLLNDLDVVLRAEAEHFPLYGVRIPTVDERKNAFCFPIQKYYENIGFDFSHRSFTEINAHFMQIYYRIMEEAPLFEGTLELLSDIRKAGKRQFILSAAPQSHLDGILSKYQVREHFAAVYGLPNTDAHSKVERGRELIREQNVNVDTTIMIGDTEHDFEVASALGLASLLVSDGHCPFENLIKIHDRVLRSRF